MPTRIACACLLALAACSSVPRERPERLTCLRSVPVEYRAELAPSAAQAPSAEPAPDLPVQALASAAGKDAPQIEVRCEFLRVAPEVERDLLGPATVEGQVLAREGFDAARARCLALAGMDLLSAPRLSVYAGQRGQISTCDQTAFVRAFTLTSVGGALLADPEVASVEEGLRLSACPRPVDGKVEVELVLESRDLVRPLHEIAARLPGTRQDFVLQTPVEILQRLAAKPVLARDEVLVLRGLFDGEGRPFLACVACAQLEPPAAAFAPRGSP